MTKCPDCYGTTTIGLYGDGKCDNCYGDGEGLLSGLNDALAGSRIECWKCDGSGVCQTCDGSGEVESPIGADDSYSSDGDFSFEEARDDYKEDREFDYDDCHVDNTIHSGGRHERETTNSAGSRSLRVSPIVYFVVLFIGWSTCAYLTSQVEGREYFVHFLFWWAFVGLSAVVCVFASLFGSNMCAGTGAELFWPLTLVVLATGIICLFLLTLDSND